MQGWGEVHSFPSVILTDTDERNVRQIPMAESIILPFVILVSFRHVLISPKPHTGAPNVFLFMCVFIFLLEGDGDSVICNLQKMQNFN